MKYLWAIAALIVMAGTAEATTRYASNVGTGAAPCTTNASAAAMCPVTTMLAQLVAGDTGNILGDTMGSPRIYQGASAMLVPTVGLSGTVGNVITVKCSDISGTANPGACLIDGQFVRGPFVFNTNSYWTISGLNFKQSSNQVISLFASTNNTISEVIAWDAQLHKNACIVTTNGGSNNVFVDFAAFGVGRKVFCPSQGNDTGAICNRCWLRWEGNIEQGPKFGATTAYTSDNTVFVNTLVTVNALMLPTAYNVTNGGTQTATRITGGQIYNYGSHFGRDKTDGCNTSTSILNTITYTLATDVIEKGSPNDLGHYAIGYASSGQVGQGCSTIENSLAVFAPTFNHFSTARGFYLGSAGSGNTYSHLTSIRGTTDIFGNFTNLDGTVSAGTALASVQDPWTGSGGGANLCFQYEGSGQSWAVSATPMWPWPMNARILAATGQSGNYFSNGGPGCAASIGNCTGIPTTNRAAIDVTADIESLLGTIPAACRSDSAEEPFPDFTGYPTHGQLSAFSGSATPPTGFAKLTGGDWTESGGVASAGSFGIIYYDTLFAANQEAWAEITTAPATGADIGINFLILNDANRYRARAVVVSGTNNDTIILDKKESGVTTTIATISLGRDIASGDRLGVRVTDSVIEVGYYANWSGTTKWKLVGTGAATTAPSQSFIGVAAATPVTLTQFGGGAASPNDTTAPTQPTNLSVTPQAAVSLDLAWTASTDAVGVTEYRVYRGLSSDCSDCVVIGTNSTNAYTDGSATPGTTHYYRVTARDAALNESTASSIVAGRVPDGVAYSGGSGRLR